MNKRLIRLTESDLHKIVKESVQKILSEAINELDPRTYASYADKRAAQGKNNKAWQGQVAARDAFNKQFGTDSSMYSKYGFSNDYYGMHENDYTVEDSEAHGSYDDDGYTTLRGSTQKYNPHTDEYDFRYWNRRTNEPPSDPIKATDRRRYDPRNKIASQMAKGNGKYIKGKGWQ